MACVLTLDHTLHHFQNPHIRTGEKKGVCHHWVVDPNHLIDASKAEHELNLRLTEMDVSIKKNDDEIKAVQKDLRKLNTEISNKSGHDRKCTSGRIRRATASLTKLKAIKERLTEYKAAMQAAVDHTNTKGVGCAKWTWVTADDILDSISGSNDIHPKYTVASHTGIYVDGNFKRHEAQGTRLCAVASLALADNPYDASHQTQHVVVSVTLMTYIGKLWYYAVQSDDNPPGRVMTIEKRAWAEEGGLAKVAEQAEDGLNR